MTDDQFLLANAYVDGDVSAHERALAEADPVVMHEVEQLRMIRRSLADVPPASSVTRTAAIAAALNSWAPTAASNTAAASPTSASSTAFAPPEAHFGDALPESAATPISAARSARRSNRRWASPERWLGAAAAVMIVGVGAVVVVSKSRSDTGTDKGAAPYEVVSALDDRAAPAMASETAAAYDMSADYASSDDFASSDAMTSDRVHIADSIVDNAPKALPSLEGTAEAGSSEAAVPITPIPGLQFSEDDLHLLAIELINARSTVDQTVPEDVTLGAVTDDCTMPALGYPTVLGNTTVLSDDTERPVVSLVIVLDGVGFYVYAIDPETCVAVLETPLDS